MPTKTPTSSLSAIELLAMRIWYRGRARIKKGFFGGASPVTSTESSSPATRLPQEVVDMIIAHLMHDTRDLLACSLTSRSWYIAAVPQLRLTLTIPINRPYEETEWSEPLRAAFKLGLLPFVTRVFIVWNTWGVFSSERFHHRIRQEFSTLANVQELSIDNLGLPSFMPRIQEYFGQFSPTLQSLTLRKPVGTCRQLVFFIGLFPHLEDLELHDYLPNPVGDPTLVPPSVPSLRGRLTASNFHGGDLARTIVDLFGGLRFRHMDLSNVAGTHFLLYGCGNALETLKLQATDICDMFSRDLNLSRNKSLQTLEITAQSLIRALKERAPTATPSSFRAAFSTIKSPVFSDFIVVYSGCDFYNVMYSTDTGTWFGDENTWYYMQFKVFREMYKARDYRLVLRACCVSDGSVRELKRAVEAEKAKGGLPLQLTMPYTLTAY